MKCPKCHKEVEKGSLYCPYCLAEIPWVREFSTVETLMKKEQQNRPSERKHKTKIVKYFKHRKRRKLKFSKKQILCLLLCAATLLGFFLLSAVKYFLPYIPGQKNNMHSKTMKKHSGLQKMLWIKIPKMKPPIFFWPKVWRNQAINDLHFLFCARLSRTKLREQEYIKSM